MVFSERLLENDGFHARPSCDRSIQDSPLVEDGTRRLGKVLILPSGFVLDRVGLVARLYTDWCVLLGEFAVSVRQPGRARMETVRPCAIRHLQQRCNENSLFTR